METEELIKLVDGIYKNILDKFNPGARQMINAGKAYLKALHGAAAASRLYVDAISKLARQAQQGTWGGCADIGTALMKVVEIYKEIQDQQMNILKAFYVDLLVPLEINLEKDTKVVQSEQKRFLQQHKQRSETYSKAAAIIKKQRKKSKGVSKGGLAMDKELKNMQVLEEEKTKLDSFCEQSLKAAMTQERRRYGFVLERHCSLTKHYMSYHNHAETAYQQNLDTWSEVAKTREYLPESVENIFSNKIRHVSIWQDDDVYSNPRSPHYDDDRMSINSQLRKTKSMDASCLDIRSIEDAGSPIMSLSKAKSEFNLNSSTNSLIQETNSPMRCRPKSMAISAQSAPQWETQLSRALYAYLSSGDNQLSFLEGDIIALIGERNKGWQFGENLRTQCTGWFPLAYTEVVDDSAFSPKHKTDLSESSHHGTLNSVYSTGTLTPASPSGPQPNSNALLETPIPRMFGDTIHLHRSSANAKQIRRAIASNNIPPPALPAPVPTPTLPYQKSGLTQSQSTNFSMKSDTDSQISHSQTTGIKGSNSTFNFSSPVSGSYSTHPQISRTEKPLGVNALPSHLQGKSTKIGVPVGNVSLHSSNDSGFSNDPPPQPEVDYSDDDSLHGHTKMHSRKARRESFNDTNNNETLKPQKVKQYNSTLNISDSRNYTSDDQSLVLRVDNKRNFVKRTKSFWKFGKSSSDNEVLEGMSLWKHRDLVDVNENVSKKINNKHTSTLDRSRKPSRDKSNDSDKTINGKNYENGSDRTLKSDRTIKSTNSVRKNVKQKHRSSSPNNKLIASENEDFENHFDKANSKQEFYDHEDGLILRTVNRRNILQQYNNNSSEFDSDSETEITSDDPYDCIVVDDQKIKKSQDQFSNVAAIGKKLEKFSKNSKYSPNKLEKNVEDIHNYNSIKRNNVTKIKNEKNDFKNQTNSLKIGDTNNRYRENYNTFSTFHRESKSNNNNNNNNENKPKDNENFSPQHIQNKQRQFKDDNENEKMHNRHVMKSSYESINSETDQFEVKNIATINRTNSISEIKNSQRYYRDRPHDVSIDDPSNDIRNRQFLPRTKLTKTNSGGSNANEEAGLLNYGETLKRRLNGSDNSNKYNEKSHGTGNMYGPWYDLWGLDASVQK